jgi:folate-binding protein YgfZ
MFSTEGYQALCCGAGIVRRGDRGVLSVTGRDRLTWLQGLLTNDVAALRIGGACEAAYLTPQGRMITDMRVVHLAEQTLLDVPASLARQLTSKLDGLLFSEDAQIADVSATLSILDVHGPKAPTVVHATREHDAGLSAITSDSPYGVAGFSLFVPANDTDAWVVRLSKAGGVPATLETLDVIRVEAGRPAFLVDMDEHTIPLEAGIEDRTISFTKGCYVGQEVIVRVMHRGQGRVAKKLVGLTLATDGSPKAGDVIAAGDRVIGRVTSAVWSPTLDRSIALGYVHRDFIEVGTQVEVRAANGSLTATVSSLPFVNRRLGSLDRHVEGAEGTEGGEGTEGAEGTDGVEGTAGTAGGNRKWD